MGGCSTTDGRSRSTVTSRIGFVSGLCRIGRELCTDAWMFGKNTLRAAFPYKWGIDGHTVESDSPAVSVGDRHSERMFIVADPEADIYFTSSVLRGNNILVIVGRNATRSTSPHLAGKTDFLRHHR